MCVIKIVLSKVFNNHPCFKHVYTYIFDKQQVLSLLDIKYEIVYKNFNKFKAYVLLYNVVKLHNMDEFPMLSFMMDVSTPNHRSSVFCGNNRFCWKEIGL